MSNRIGVIKRDDCFFELTFKDVDGNAIDLTDCLVFFTVKRNIDDTDDQAIIKKEIDDFAEPTSGIATLWLTHDDTNIDPGYYAFDIQLKDTADQISSSSRGTFIVEQDITIRTHDHSS